MCIRDRDTNGAKKPNKEGYDRYKIYVYQDGTVSNNPVDMPDLPAVNNDTNSSDNSEDSNSKDDSNGSGSGGSITIEIEIKIDSNEINYSSINGYGTGEIYERGKGWSGSKEKAYEKACQPVSYTHLQERAKFIDEASAKYLVGQEISPILYPLYKIKANISLSKIKSSLQSSRGKFSRIFFVNPLNPV